MSEQVKYRLHLWLTLSWLVLGAPLSILWAHSVAWVVLMSWYAIVVSHWSVYQAGQAERAARRCPGRGSP